MRYSNAVLLRVVRPCSSAATVTMTLTVMACAFGGFSSTAPPRSGPPTEAVDVVALAGPDLVVVEGSRVALDGGGSRALVGAVRLSWAQREGPPVLLSNPSSAQPLFTAPLAPARLVFTLSASIDSETDSDEVVVDVVAAEAEVVPPRVQGSIADVTGAAGTLVELRQTWRGAGAPAVRPRCALAEPTTVVRGDSDVTIGIVPARLPCAIVIDDDGEVGRAGRMAVVVWPPGTALPGETRVSADAVVDPGALIVVEAEQGTQLRSVDGTPIVIESDGAGVSLRAPRRAGSIQLVAERRVDGISGGLLPVPVAVRAGRDNEAPVVDAGPDLRVRPGARFRIAATVVDGDADDTTVTVRQVLGAPAGPVRGFVDVFTAPEEASTLLFHAVADDGTVESKPDPVRVVVDPGVENLAPELSVPEVLYVVPGERFVLDAAGARDPDSGLIAAFAISQDEDDDVILLPEPILEPRVELTAGAAGDTMHFLLSAYDEGGLGVTVTVTVIVENAGPFVDPARGSDIDGVGSAERPFATIAGAIATAARHRFPTLQLTAATHAPFEGALPDGLGLAGGYRFDGAGYVVEPGARGTVPMGATGISVAGGTLRSLSIVGPDAAMRLSRVVEVEDVHFDALVTIDGGRTTARAATFARGVLVGGGRLVLEGCDVDGLVAMEADVDVSGGRIAGDPAVRVEGGVFVSAADVEIAGGASGIELVDATASLAGAVTCDAAVTVARGVLVDGGSVALDGLHVSCLVADDAVGIEVAGGIVQGSGTVDVEANAAVGRARGVTGAFVDLQEVTVTATASDAIAIDVSDVALTRAVVFASGAQAMALRGPKARLSATVLSAEGDDVVGADVHGGELRHVTVRTTGGSGLCIRHASDDLLVVGNSILVGAVAVEGAPVLTRVGIVGAVLPDGCDGCVLGAGDLLDDRAHLVGDDVLGRAHPFVDAGDPAFSVPFDVDGDPIPAGAGPDLGADER